MRTTTKRLVAGSVLAAAMGLGGVPLAAQDTEVSERGLQVTGSYRLGEIETVNTKNGNVMLRVPLTSLPPGRGGDPGFQLSLNYNSKLWDLSERYQEDLEAGPNEPPVKLVHKLVRNFANPGWAYSYQYQIVVEDRYDHAFETLSGNAPCSQSSDMAEMEREQGHWYRFKVWVVFPDGSARLFRPAGEADYSGYEDDYFQIHPTGWKRLPYSEGFNGANKRHGYRAPASGAVTTYYSVDGSYLRLDFEADEVPYLPADVECGQVSAETTWTAGEIRNWQDNRWTLTFPDGRRVSGTGLMADEMTGRDWEQLEEDDPNDNRTTITIGRYLTDGGDPIDEIRDEVDRTIVVERGSGPAGTDRVRWQGRGGSELTWTVHRSETKVWREYDADPDVNNQVKDFVCERLKMVDWIQPPAELGGSASRRWEFAYNGNSPTTPCSRDQTSPFKPPSNPSTGLGELATVTLPSGASASYRYAQNIRDTSDTDGSGAELGEATMLSARAGTNSAIVRKVVRHDNLAETWDYSVQGTPPGGNSRQWDQSLITASDGGRIRETYNLDGMLEKVERLKVISGTETVQEVVERYWAYNIPAGIDSGSVATLRANPYVKAQYRTAVTGTGTLSKAAVTTFAYDQNGNLTQRDEYDWVDYDDVLGPNGKPTGAPAGTLKRRTVHTYHASGTTDAYHKASSPRLKTARKSTEIQDGSGARLSRREFTYGTDNADARTTGNLTEERIWDSTRGSVSNPLTSTNSFAILHTYDSRGNRLTTTDGEGIKTEWSYGTNNLYPARQVEASEKDGGATTVARTMDYTYDLWTGAVTSVKDVDNGVTTRTTVDAVGRPVIVEEADGVSGVERQTRTWYCDAERRLIVRSDLAGDSGNGELVTVTDYDQLGRVSLSRSWESGAPAMPPGTPSPAHCGAYGDESDSDRDVIKVETHYEHMSSGSAPGFYTWTSNPYRQTSDATMGWTRTRRDRLGREAEVGPFQRGHPALGRRHAQLGQDHNRLRRRIHHGDRRGPKGAAQPLRWAGTAGAGG